MTSKQLSTQLVGNDEDSDFNLLNEDSTATSLILYIASMDIGGRSILFELSRACQVRDEKYLSALGPIIFALDTIISGPQLRWQSELQKQPIGAAQDHIGASFLLFKGDQLTLQQLEEWGQSQYDEVRLPGFTWCTEQIGNALDKAFKKRHKNLHPVMFSIFC